MTHLDDYLDALSLPPKRERAFGTAEAPRVTTSLTMDTPAAVSNLLNKTTEDVYRIFDARETAEVDRQMWTLDLGWSPIMGPHGGPASSTSRSRWERMTTCSRISKLGDSINIESYYSDVVARDGCVNWRGDVQPAQCSWGFFRLLDCTVETAAKYQFQIARYVWAQTRMREMLATQPRPGITSAQDAADWTWRASQFMSALLWATNIRFNNPNMASVPAYAEVWQPTPAPSAWNLGRTAMLPLLALKPFATVPGELAYDGPPTPFPPVPFGDFADGGFPGVQVLNVLGDPRTAPPVPMSREDFSPQNASVWPAIPADKSVWAYATPSGPVPFLRTDAPLGLTHAQLNEMMSMGARYIAETGAQYPSRWAYNKARTDWWFRATWNWDTTWKPVGNFHLRDSSGNWDSRVVTFVNPSARIAVAKMAQLLQHYSDPAVSINTWMATAMERYAAETGNLAATAAAVDMRASAAALQAQIGQSTAMTATALGRDYSGAAVQTTIGVVTAALQFIPIYGQLIGALLQGLNGFLIWLFNSGVSGSGEQPCSALPFIRIMSAAAGEPPCLLTSDAVVAAALGIESRTPWPVPILGGQWIRFAIDGRTVNVTFPASGPGLTAEQVARAINAAAAGVGLPLPVGGLTSPTAAVVRSGTSSQVRVSGTDGSPVVVTGGNAFALRFPGLDTPPPPGAPVPTGPPPVLVTLTAAQRRGILDVQTRVRSGGQLPSNVVRLIQLNPSLYTTRAGTLDPVSLCRAGEVPNPATGICDGGVYGRPPAAPTSSGGGALALGVGVLLALRLLLGGR